MSLRLMEGPSVWWHLRVKVLFAHSMGTMLIPLRPCGVLVLFHLSVSFLGAGSRVPGWEI